jgi:hypothetical protein
MLNLVAHLSIIFYGVREAALSASPAKTFYYTPQETLKRVQGDISAKPTSKGFSLRALN